MSLYYFFRHVIIKKLHKLITSDPELAGLLTNQVCIKVLHLLERVKPNLFKNSCKNYYNLNKIYFKNSLLQLFANAMVGAGLVQDPNILLTSMNDLLAKALDKH